MPPGPAFNFVCAAAGLANILSHAARIRAAQIAPKVAAAAGAPRNHVRTTDSTARDQDRDASTAALDRDNVTSTRTPNRNEGGEPGICSFEAPYDTKAAIQPAVPKWPKHVGISNQWDGLVKERVLVQEASKTFDISAFEAQEVSPMTPHHEPPSQGVVSQQAEPLDGPPSNPQSAVAEPIETGSSTIQPTQGNPHQPKLPEDTASANPDIPSTSAEVPQSSRVLRSSKVPSSRIGRLFHYGSLAASLGYGAAAEIIQRTTNTSQNADSPIMMTEANIQRLVSKLLKMRGAALKLGQFMSIQDTHVLPPAADKIFRMVQDSAHYMPDWQMEQVLASSLGDSWESNFVSFSRIPFAAASIGQVHRAILAPAVSPTGKAEAVAVKIQFPNIADSIESDLGYIKMLLTAGKLLPKGLFLDRTIHVMKEELADECDYTREAYFLRMFGRREYLGADARFKVPWVWSGSTSNVLVMEHVHGIAVGDTNVGKLSQQDRDDIASRVIELCLRELFEFGLMQTDPNWTNFLWNTQTRQMELVDFGATREYTQEFTDNWLHLLQAAVMQDRDECIEWSTKIGYLTGEENDIMLDAHVESMMLLATPFTDRAVQPFEFGQNSAWAEATARIREIIPIMLQHRKTPPPRETYSLNRKLSGSFLLASRLGARVNTKELWDRVVGSYEFSS
ncbi:hypothetical protein HGRIS_007072 [Hohenbuehelia grisea]|uniref:ABC1 atypical kinase-like domain-containing protein n=1 Tax=Hohenbuehelia grisea TaxID=104357 RepID=A0ABR3JBI7_9AGAR